jgi:hypothetical protein
MGYIQGIEKELRDRLEFAKTGLYDSADEKGYENWAADLTKFVKEKVWESYRNGQKAAKTGAEGKGADKRTGKPAMKEEA